MLVVSDATPVNVLVRTGDVRVLGELFQSVLVPSAVVEELTHPKTPEAVRAWITRPPGWLTVRRAIHAGPANLGRGEAEAIALARETGADAVLMDDAEARRAAARTGLRVVGTVGVLELADVKGLVDLPGAFARLTATDFLIDPAVLAAALDRRRARQGL